MSAVAAECDAELPPFPAALCPLVARLVSQDDLPALRLTSKRCHDAANSALRHVKKRWLTLTQRQHLPTAVHKFPGSAVLDLIYLDASKNAQRFLQEIMSVSRLQGLTLFHSLAQLPVGQQFISQQSHLTSSAASHQFCRPGAGILDSFLPRVASMTSLVTLDLALSDAVTDAAIDDLSGLTNLQSLCLHMSKYEACVSGRSMTVFTALSKLTQLSLPGWPLQDTHVAVMMKLKYLQRVDLSECESLSCLCFMPLLQFVHLTALEIVRGDEWLVHPIVNMFALLKPQVKLTL